MLFGQEGGEREETLCPNQFDGKDPGSVGGGTAKRLRTGESAVGEKDFGLVGGGERRSHYDDSQDVGYLAPNGLQLDRRLFGREDGQLAVPQVEWTTTQVDQKTACPTEGGGESRARGGGVSNGLLDNGVDPTVYLPGVWCVVQSAIRG